MARIRGERRASRPPEVLPVAVIGDISPADLWLWDISTTSITGSRNIKTQPFHQLEADALKYSTAIFQSLFQQKLIEWPVSNSNCFLCKALQPNYMAQHFVFHLESKCLGFAFKGENYKKDDSPNSYLLMQKREIATKVNNIRNHLPE